MWREALLFAFRGGGGPFDFAQGKLRRARPTGNGNGRGFGSPSSVLRESSLPKQQTIKRPAGMGMPALQNGSVWREALLVAFGVGGAVVGHKGQTAWAGGPSVLHSVNSLLPYGERRTAWAGGKLLPNSRGRRSSFDQG